VAPDNEAYLLDAVRTPFGRYGGALARTRPDDLAAIVLRAITDRNPGLDPADLDDVLMGAANAAGEDNRNVGRMAGLLAGWPTSVPGATVNRLCGSGLEAVVQARRAVFCRDADLVVAGGVESMSRAPWVLPKPAEPFPREAQTLHSTTLGWRMVNPLMPSAWTLSLGESTEHLADLHGIGRPAQDAFAARSHALADAAWTAGRYDDEIVPVPGADLGRDESIRPGTSPQGLARLKPVFRHDGTVTAGNSSPLSDGAGAVLIGSTAGAAAAGCRPIARIAASAVSGVDPDVFGIGPVRAAETALRRAGIGWADVAQVELNEAFAAQSLACLAGWPDLDPDLVNPDGGALALGHPLGASGTRVVGHLAHSLRARGGGWGLAALCIGVGQGIAVVLEVDG
jgi:acetyl-CoA acetyltransferase family protein